MYIGICKSVCICNMCVIEGYIKKYKKLLRKNGQKNTLIEINANIIQLKQHSVFLIVGDFLGAFLKN